MKRLTIVLLFVLMASVVFAATNPADLQVTSWKWTRTPASAGYERIAITGVVKNKSTTVWYESVTIEISIIRLSDNVKIQTQRSTQTNMGPGDVWQFKPYNDITVKTSDNFTSKHTYRLDRIVATPMER